MNRQFAKKIRRLEELDIELADEALQDAAVVALNMYANAHSFSSIVWNVTRGLIPMYSHSPYFRLSRDISAMQETNPGKVVKVVGADARRLRSAARYAESMTRTVEWRQNRSTESPYHFAALQQHVDIGGLL